MIAPGAEPIRGKEAVGEGRFHNGTPEMHQAFLDAGLYHLYVPLR